MRTRALRFRELMILTALVPALLVAPYASRSQAAQDKPQISVLATGGTIAGSATSQTEAAYTAGQLGVELLLSSVPQLSTLADLSGEQIANVGSQDMSDDIWLTLARRVNALLDKPDVGGIVITHGTDTLEETAYFLNLTVKSEKPVVLTAAMRPATALSADGPLNIYNAVAVAVDPQAAGRGVLIVVNDDIHGARGVSKSHTTDVQAFDAGEYGLIGTALYGKNRWYRVPWKAHTTETPFSISKIEALPRVDVLYVTAGMSADLVDAAVASGARGIVMAGVGNGNMPASVLAAVQRAVEAGVLVVRSSRTGHGAVRRNGEINDDAVGTVAAAELNPARARILLKLALLETSDPAKIQRFFYTY